MLYFFSSIWNEKSFVTNRKKWYGFCTLTTTLLTRILFDLWRDSPYFGFFHKVFTDEGKDTLMWSFLASSIRCCKMFLSTNCVDEGENKEMCYTHIKDISQYELCRGRGRCVIYTYRCGTIFFLLNRNMSISSLTPILFWSFYTCCLLDLTSWNKVGSLIVFCFLLKHMPFWTVLWILIFFGPTKSWPYKKL